MVEVRETSSASSNASRAGGGYLIAISGGGGGDQQGWVPSYVLNLLTNNPKRPAWTFKKFRKPSFSSGGGGGGGKQSAHVPSSESSTPVVVNCGETAVLKCPRLSGVGVKWTGPSGHLLINSGRKYSLENDDHVGSAVLYIADCDVKDGGDYTCVQQGNSNVIKLKVKGAKKFILCETTFFARKKCKKNVFFLKNLWKKLKTRASTPPPALVIKRLF
jgi:hypothetical protein